jgi:two-component system response regulator DevR
MPAGRAPVSVGVIVVEPLPVVRAGLELLVAATPGCSLIGGVGSPDDALEAVARSRRHRVTVLVSLETQADGVDAFATIRLLRERHPAVGVLAMGAHADAATISRALFVGADGYVDLRSEPGEFFAALARPPDQLLVLTGPSTEAVGLVAAALVERGDGGVHLTRREREVIALAVDGLTAREIGERLGVRERTVTTHLSRIYQKLGVKTRLAAVRAATRAGLVANDA